MTPPVWLEFLILLSEVCIIVDTSLFCARAVSVAATRESRRRAMRYTFFMTVFLRVILIGDADVVEIPIVDIVGGLCKGGREGVAREKSGFFPGAMALPSDDGSIGKIQHL